MSRSPSRIVEVALALAVGIGSAMAQAPSPHGEVMGTAWEHTAASLAGVVQQADAVLPSAAAGGAVSVISNVDPFFSRSDGWLGNAQAAGHCGHALKGLPEAAVVLIPDAPHTLLNLPAARHAVAGFLAAHGLR